MTPKVKIGLTAPLLSTSAWLQGDPVNFDTLTGRVVLVEVFQVNCPGCFLHTLPQAIMLHQKYAAHGLSVLGLATAFEDFELNTLENLQRLIQMSEVIGETHRRLAQYGKLSAGKLRYRIPFPVAMDKLIKRQQAVSETEVSAFISANVPDFGAQTAALQQQLRKRVKNFLESRRYVAETFDRFNLQGTPSHIIVDKSGILCACEFGGFAELEALLQKLLGLDSK